MRMTWIERVCTIAIIVGFCCSGAWAQTYFFEDFENGLGYYEVSGQDWGVFKADSAKSPWDAIDKYCLWSNPGGNYLSDVNTSATLTKAIDIRNANFPILIFWSRNALDAGDAIFVEMSYDNGFSWTPIWSRAGYSYLTSWDLVKIDLRVYKNSKFIFRFRLKSDYRYESWGWLIDNVEIKEFDIGNAYQVPFEDGFESGVYHWNVSGYDWAVTNETAQEGQHCFTDSPKRNYWAYAENKAILDGFIDLSTAKQPILTMWHKYYISSGDGIGIQISTDSSWTWQNVKSWGEGTLNSWQKVQVDLSKFVGQKIWLQIRFFSDYRYENNGWFIDNLKIYDAGNENPLIDSFSASPQQGYKPLPVQFTCQAHDPDGSISAYRWDLDGDGLTDTTTTTGSLAYIYQRAGAYDAVCTAVDSGGASTTSQKLRITVLSNDDRRITLADTAAAPGTLLKLAIRIDDASGLAALQGRLRFDPALLEATQIETSALTSEFSLADSLLPGKAAFSLARATGLPARDGDLLYVTLLVKSDAQPGDTCSLALENMRLFDETSTAISHTVRQGLFTVNIPGGAAGFYIQPDTLIVAAGQSINLQTFLRAADGQVTAAASDWTLEPLAEIGKTRIVGALSGSSGTQVTLQTKRIGDGRIIARSGGQTDTAWVCVQGLAGDVTADSLIMANDPGQILRAAISLPLAPLPPGHRNLTLYEYLAADYNSDRVVNVDDAKLVLDKSLDNILRRTSSGPAMAGISAVQTSGDDLLYTVTMQLRDDIAATRMTLSYDAAEMTLIGVAPAVTGGQCLRNEIKPGRVLIAAIHPQQMVDANQQLLLLQFRSRRHDLPTPPVIDRIELFDQQSQPVDVLLTASEPNTSTMPGTFQLDQNYPNPFNPVTTISYGLQRDTHVRLDVYNANGQLVCTLVEGEKSAGLWQATWDGRNAAGEHLGSGIYFCRLQIDRGSFVETRKMVLMR